MIRCEKSEELAIECMLALDAVAAAQKAVGRAFTQMQMECASTSLLRVEAHKFRMFQELAEHCAQHRCMTPEMATLLMQRQAPGHEVAYA